jgi:RNA recognition motif-containing protein
MEMPHHQDASSLESSNEMSLFVGCLDPNTTKVDIMNYFKQYDPQIKAKLIVNFKTGQSKQCALLFCSSGYFCDLILHQEHHLHQRRLRIDRAQQEYKGKKADNFIAVQVSGLDPAISIGEVNKVFGCFEGFTRARLIQGLHPKQKKVAVGYFSSFEKAQQILAFSHLQIGNRNCKVAEYTKDKPFNLKPNIHQDDDVHKTSNIDLHHQPSLLEVPKYFSNKNCHSYQGESSKSIDSSSARSIGNVKPKYLTPLKLDTTKLLPKLNETSHQYRKTSADSYVHHVEAENDDLFRIFCESKDKLGAWNSAIVTQLDKSAVKIIESKETAPEEEEQ